MTDVRRERTLLLWSTEVPNCYPFLTNKDALVLDTTLWTNAITKIRKRREKATFKKKKKKKKKK